MIIFECKKNIYYIFATHFPSFCIGYDVGRNVLTAKESELSLDNSVFKGILSKINIYYKF